MLSKKLHKFIAWKNVLPFITVYIMDISEKSSILKGHYYRCKIKIHMASMDEDVILNQKCKVYQSRKGYYIKTMLGRIYLHTFYKNGMYSGEYADIFNFMEV